MSEIKNFEYCVSTNVIFGRDSHKDTGKIIKNYGFKKIMLHYGMGSVKKSGLYDEIVKSLNENGIDFTELGGAEPNPKIGLVREGVSVCKRENVEMILAVGGGSVIDSAKVMAIAALSDYDAWDFSCQRQKAERSLPVGCVLTIAASGSETSTSAVITNNVDGNLKRGFNSEQNRPLFAILNPCLTFSVSKYQTACGIVDIMMHTLERYFTTSKPFKITDSISEGLLRTVIDAGKRAIDNPCDYDARANLMWAGSLSHNGITGLGTAHFMECHQIEHELSGMFDSVAHGAGLAVIFPAWAKYILKYNVDRFFEFAVNVWGINPYGKEKYDVAMLGIEKCEEFFKSIGMPVKLNELNIDVSDGQIEEMAEKCTFFGKRTLPDYIELGKKEIIDIYNLAK